MCWIRLSGTCSLSLTLSRASLGSQWFSLWISSSTWIERAGLGLMLVDDLVDSLNLHRRSFFFPLVPRHSLTQEARA